MANSLGRFTSVDPDEQSWILQNPQTLNRYNYSLDNPLSLIDPDGRAPKQSIELVWTRMKHIILNHVKDDAAAAGRSKFLEKNPRAVQKLIRQTVKEEHFVETQRLKKFVGINRGRNVFQKAFNKEVGPRRRNGGNGDNRVY
jgi:hypothetical protein